MDLIHSDKYADAIKIASKFTSKHSGRPILLFVNHKEDGSMEATDSHTFVKVKNIHGFKTNYLVHPKTLEFATGNYPDLTRAIGGVDKPTKVELTKEQIAIWLQLHRSINQLSKHYDPQNRTVNLNADKGILLTIGKKNHVDMDLPFRNVIGSGSVNYNAEYMRNCLEAHHVLGTEKIELLINGKMRPIILSGDDVISGLTPIRVY